MAHGSGGRASHTLVNRLFLELFRNPLLEKLDDQAVFALDEDSGPRLALTTDSFVIHPLFFPGGDIGKLAVHGTINDLAMSGARPLHLSAGFILEEGLPLGDLQRIAESMAEACARCGVAIVTGDTKVVNRGKGDGVFINTTGIGIVPDGVSISASNARPGDRVIVSGPIGEHGVAIMIARGGLDFEAEIASDTAALHSLVGTMLAVTPRIHCLRDPTRGGVATVLNEIAERSEVGIVIDEARVPVSEPVRSACEVLGIDPLYVANEGKLVAVVPGDVAEDVVSAMRQCDCGLGREATIVGEVVEEPRRRVLLRTALGGTRIVDMLVGDPLPRIC